MSSNPHSLPNVIGALTKQSEAAKRSKQTATEIMDEMEYNPIKEMVLMAKDLETPNDLRLACNKELMKYYAPQLKSIEVSARQAPVINVTINTFAEPGQEEPPRVSDRHLDAVQLEAQTVPDTHVELLHQRRPEWDSVVAPEGGKGPDGNQPGGDDGDEAGGGLLALITDI